MSRIITCFLLLISFFSQAQLSTYLMVYQNTDIAKREIEYRNIETGDINVEKQYISNFNRISAGIGLINSNSWYTEIELSYSKSPPAIEYEMREYGSVTRDHSNFYFQAETGLMIAKKNNFSFFTGLGLSTYFSDSKITPTSPNTFPTTYKPIGIILTFIPKIQYRLTKNIRLDLNTKFGMLDFRKDKVIVHNPAIPIAQQSDINTKWIFFPNSYTIRFGISYLLTNKS